MHIPREFSNVRPRPSESEQGPLARWLVLHRRAAVAGRSLGAAQASEVLARHVDLDAALHLNLARVLPDRGAEVGRERRRRGGSRRRRTEAVCERAEPLLAESVGR